MHFFKALSLKIVQRPSKIVFIKGRVSKLHISAFPTFVFESAGFLQSIGFSMQRALKDAGLNQ